ncbi:MAG: hypothetical protein ACK4N5_02575, partial [Myxococcales bacterium]
ATLTTGRSAAQLEVGWPGAYLTFLRGQNETLDVGGRIGFQYGFEGRPEEVFPGVQLAGTARLQLYRDARMVAGVRASPGLLLYFPNRVTSILGVGIPVEAMGGYMILPNLSAHAGLSLPMSVLFMPRIAFYLPVQAGGGVEYRVDENLSLTADTRVGPLFRFEPRGPFTSVSFRVLLGAGYRF